MKLLVMLCLVTNIVVAQDAPNVISLNRQDWGPGNAIKAAEKAARVEAKMLCGGEIEVIKLTSSLGRCVEGRCTGHASITFLCL